MAFPWAMLAGAAMKFGQAKRRESEQYDFLSGGFEDPSKLERNYAIGAMLAPHTTWTDPDVAGIDKALNIILPGVGGLISALTGGGRRYRRKKEERLRRMQQKAHAILEETPGYEVPQEALDLMSTTAEGADKVRQYSDQALELSKEATGKEKMPGLDIVKEDIRAGQAQATQSLVEQAGVQSLGNIHEIQASSNASLKDLAMKNMLYRGKGVQEYKDLLGERAQMESAAVGLETIGLGEVAAAKDTQFQLEVLDSHYNKLQWDLAATGSQYKVQPVGTGSEALGAAGLSVLNLAQSGAFQRQGGGGGGQQIDPRASYPPSIR